MASDVSLKAARLQVRSALLDDTVRFFRASREIGIVKTPFGESVKVPGFDFEADSRIFTVLYDAQSDLNDLDLEIAHRNLRVRAIEERNRSFFSPRAIRNRGQNEERAPDFTNRIRSIINDLSRNSARIRKTDGSNLPSLDKRPTTEQSFSSVLNNTQPRNSSLTLSLQQRVSLGLESDIDFSQLETTPPTQTPTHYLVRISGSADKGGLTPAAGSLRVLDAARNIVRTIDNNTPTLITAAEFATLNYQATERDFLQKNVDYFSIIPVNQLTPGSTLDPNDEVGGLNTVFFGIQDTLRLLAQGTAREYQAKALVESGSRFQRTEVTFSGNFVTGSALDDYNNGHLKINVSEFGKPAIGSGANQATLDVATSSGNRLVFNFFNDNVSDGVNVHARYETPPPGNLIDDITVSFL